MFSYQPLFEFPAHSPHQYLSAIIPRFPGTFVTSFPAFPHPNAVILCLCLLHPLPLPRSQRVQRLACSPAGEE